MTKNKRQKVLAARGADPSTWQVKIDMVETVKIVKWVVTESVNFTEISVTSRAKFVTTERRIRYVGGDQSFGSSEGGGD